jgi:uncharacterized damage-inducible protein DinB
MKKLLFYLVCSLPVAAWCQEPSFQDEFAGMIHYNAERVVALAEAIPAETYDWRPADGVRSVGEVILHTASANYFFSTILGGELPEGIDPGKLEETIQGKEQIIEALKKSYQFIAETGKGVSDESLFDEVSFPTGEKFNKRTMLMIAESHVSEHMGQLIAYARMNGITPPWSEAANQNN